MTDVTQDDMNRVELIVQAGHTVLLGKRDGLSRIITEYDASVNNAARDPNSKVPAVRPRLYAIIEDITTTAIPAIPAVEFTALDDTNAECAKARQGVVNYHFSIGVQGDPDGLRTVLKKAVAMAALTKIGFVKVVYDTAVGAPRIQALDPRMFEFDRDAPTWRSVAWTIEVVIHPTDTLVARLSSGNLSPSTYVDQLQLELAQRSRDEYPLDMAHDLHAVNNLGYTKIIEMYDFKTGRMFLFLASTMKCLAHMEMPYGFNPYYPLKLVGALTSTDGVAYYDHLIGDVADGEAMDKTLQRYARVNVPVPIVSTGGMPSAESFVTSFQENSGNPDAVIVVDLPSGMDMDKAITWTRAPAVSPDFGTVLNRLDTQVSRTIGITAASRGEVGQGDLATEVAMAHQAMRGRDEDRVRTVGELLKWYALRVIDLVIKFAPMDQALAATGRRPGSLMQYRVSDLGDRQVAVVVQIDATTQRPRDAETQLALIRSHAPLINNPAMFKPQKIAQHIAGLLGLPDDCVMDDPPPQAAPGMPGMPGTPPGAGGAGGAPGSVPPSEEETDTMQGGGLPGADLKGVINQALGGVPGMAGGAGNPNPGSPQALAQAAREGV